MHGNGFRGTETAPRSEKAHTAVLSAAFIDDYGETIIATTGCWGRDEDGG